LVAFELVSRQPEASRKPEAVRFPAAEERDETAADDAVVVNEAPDDAAVAAPSAAGVTTASGTAPLTLQPMRSINWSATCRSVALGSTTMPTISAATASDCDKLSSAEMLSSRAIAVFF